MVGRNQRKRAFWAVFRRKLPEIIGNAASIAGLTPEGGFVEFDPMDGYDTGDAHRLNLGLGPHKPGRFKSETTEEFATTEGNRGLGHPVLFRKGGHLGRATLADDDANDLGGQWHLGVGRLVQGLKEEMKHPAESERCEVEFGDARVGRDGIGLVCDYLVEGCLGYEIGRTDAMPASDIGPVVG